MRLNYPSPPQNAYTPRKYRTKRAALQVPAIVYHLQLQCILGPARRVIPQQRPADTLTSQLHLCPWTVSVTARDRMQLHFVIVTAFFCV
jgi:hypothetical protein